MMIDTQNIEQAKKLIKTEKSSIIVTGQSPEFNRKILEYGKFDILLSPEKIGKKDSLRRIDSGLDNVMARIASRNGISIGIDLGDISGLKEEEKAVRLFRIANNMRICRKNSTGLKLLNFKSRIGGFNILISLGASTNQAKAAIE